MKQATHFIEQVKYPDGHLMSMSPAAINQLKWSLDTNKKFGIEVIAVFKIYPKK